MKKYNIYPHDIWNMDETGYRIEMTRNNWVVTVDPIRTMYSKYLNNRELISILKCINSVESEIPLFLILTGINILAP